MMRWLRAHSLASSIACSARSIFGLSLNNFYSTNCSPSIFSSPLEAYQKQRDLFLLHARFCSRVDLFLEIEFDFVSSSCTPRDFLSLGCVSTRHSLPFRLLWKVFVFGETRSEIESQTRSPHAPCSAKTRLVMGPERCAIERISSSFVMTQQKNFFHSFATVRGNMRLSSDNLQFYPVKSSFRTRLLPLDSMFLFYRLPAIYSLSVTAP